MVDLSGTYTITIAAPDADDTAKSLTISDTDATLSGSATFTVGSIVNDGKVEAGHGDDLTIDETGSGSQNYGTIEASHGGSLTPPRRERHERAARHHRSAWSRQHAYAQQQF